VLSGPEVDLFLVFGLALAAGPLARATPSSTPVAFAAGAFAVVLLLRWAPQRGRAASVVAVLALAIGALRGGRSIAEHESARVGLAMEMPATARCAGVGTVVGAPARSGQALRLVVEVGRTSPLECEGVAIRAPPFLVALHAPDGTVDPFVARGDAVSFVAQLAPLERFDNPELGDPAPRETRRAVLRSGGALVVEILTRGSSAVSTIDRARAQVRARIDATFPADTAPMARALVLGEADLDRDDDDAFRRSGLSHLLAVSGMHLVLVVLGLVTVLRAMLVRVEAIACRHDVGRIAALLGIAATWAYAELAGASGSTLRAAWMLTVMLTATACGRRTTTVRALGLSIVAMALVDPLVAYDVSAVLSAAATGGLVAGSTAVHQALWPKTVGDAPRPWWRRAAEAISKSAAATIAATLPCAPILARFAPTLPAGGIVANLLAVPLGESIALPLCLLHALLSPIPSAERGCAVVASGGLVLVRGVARWFAGVPWLAVPVPMPTDGQLAAIVVASVSLFSCRGRPRRVALGAAGAIVLLLELHARHAGAPSGALRVTFLDVGQGDAALVDLPDGSAMLVDAGGIVGSPVDVGERVVAPVLRARRRGSLRAVVLSHPHPDHSGGLERGLASVRVEQAWDTGQGEHEGTGGAYASFLAAMRAGGAPVLRPSELCGARDVGGARVEVLAPCPSASPDRGPNDNSLVLRISFGRRSFLFVGDAEHEEEADLLKLASGRLRADVLKVGQHGSRTSSSAAFVAAVAPSEAIVTSGVRNRFGHPAATTLETLAAAGVRVWRTDRAGAVVVETDGDTLLARASRL
jgi:competence protein ComEC